MNCLIIYWSYTDLIHDYSTFLNDFFISDNNGYICVRICNNARQNYEKNTFLTIQRFVPPLSACDCLNVLAAAISFAGNEKMIYNIYGGSL